jgi:hypothetical protein
MIFEVELLYFFQRKEKAKGVCKGSACYKQHIQERKG